MMRYEDTEHEYGSKAARLMIMKEHGLNVPDLFCIHSVSELRNRFYDPEELFSVRSSASCEDSSRSSFAGQFKTFLNVRGYELEKYIRLCLESTGTVNEYSQCMKLDAGDISVTVIVQKMISADMSGVIFTSNPQGLLNETVIALGNGTGNNVVGDRTDITHYYFNNSDGLFCSERQNSSPILTEELLRELIEISRRICGIFGEHQDIEFAIKDEEIWILQTRPVTSLDTSVLTVLDSSNISESYPGVSLPLTVSFAKEVYYQVFRSCIRRITRNDGTAERLDEQLRLMVDSVNGRLYYRISNWYDVILMLPFSKKLIPVWQEMLGVGCKEVYSGQRVKVGTKLRTTLSFFQLLFRDRHNMKELNASFQLVYEEYSSAISRTDSPEELAKLYCGLRDALAGQWDLTLVNDMYTFIFTGLLKKELIHRYGQDRGTGLTNIYISGNRDIESMRPVRLLAEIRHELEEVNALDELKAVKDEAGFEKLMSAYPVTAKKIKEYIRLYGDRCPEELKLETVTYRLAPYLICENILSASETPTCVPHDIPKLHGMAAFYAKKAAEGIKLRESSRLARGKIFALVREIALKTGNALCNDGRIDDIRDVFYLEFDELMSAYSSSLPLSGAVSKRKAQYAAYRELPLYSRLVFAGKPFDKHISSSDHRSLTTDDTVSGIPCSGGIAEGEILKVENITPDLNSDGRIIAARMTDPGWVFLMTRSAGIISEKGSLLSHTAIISRELGKPAVVGIRGLFDHVNSGDRVRINGSTGEVTILRRAEST